MATMTFLINDKTTGNTSPKIQVKIIDDGTGNIVFEVTQLVSANGNYVGDLRALFFDMKEITGNTLTAAQLDVTSFTAYSTVNLTGTPISQLTAETELQAGDDTVVDLGTGANMQGLLGKTAESKGFDVGIEFEVSSLGGLGAVVTVGDAEGSGRPVIVSYSSNGRRACTELHFGEIAQS